MTAARDEGTGPDETVPERVERVTERVKRAAEHVSLPAGVLTGIGSALGGYVLFLGLAVATGIVTTSKAVPNVLQSVGTLYYNAHYVPSYERQVAYLQEGGEEVGRRITEISTNYLTGWQRIHLEVYSGGQVVGENTRSGALESSPPIPAELYLLLPVLVLIAAGAFLALRTADLPAEGRDTTVVSLLLGGALTLGYLLVVLLGTYVLAVTGETDGSVLRPARLDALINGLVYPLILGTLVAYLGFRLRRRRETGPAETETS